MSESVVTPDTEEAPRQPKGPVAAHARDGLVLAALGVVFGDIGTSPLYALQTVFSIDHGAVQPTPGDVYGVISLMFWSITLIVSVKYVGVVMRADNDGEGGVMALAALARRLLADRARPHQVGCSVLGDPRRVAVLRRLGDHARDLGAVRGRGPRGGRARAWPTSSCRSRRSILTVLFAAQRFGTRRVGALFGPVRCSGSPRSPSPGVGEVVRAPGGPAAGCRRPTRSRSSSSTRSSRSSRSGAVVLCITGAEALYADMGHFGRPPIRRAWFFVVFPALTLNYLGQGALILHHPGAAANPFFLLLPGLGAAADGGAGHRGHGHRLPGGDLRGVLGVPAGDAARAAAAADGAADLRARGRPGLPARRSTRRCSSACSC